MKIDNAMTVFKELPRTNCRECGAPTCLVFATMVAEGAKGVEDCPPLDGDQKRALRDYMLPYRGILA